jgi:hypothetical protein
MNAAQSYPDGEGIGKELSLLMPHGINCLVRILDLFRSSGLSGYSKKQNEGRPKNQKDKGNLRRLKH